MLGMLAWDGQGCTMRGLPGDVLSNGLPRELSQRFYKGLPEDVLSNVPPDALS